MNAFGHNCQHPLSWFHIFLETLIACSGYTVWTFYPLSQFHRQQFLVQLFESVFSVAQFKFQHQCFRRFGAHYQINHGEIMTFFSPNGKNFVPYKCCKAAHKLPDDTWLLPLTQIVVARLYWLSGIWTNLTLNLVMVVRFYTRANVRNCFSYLKNDARFKSDSKIIISLHKSKPVTHSLWVTLLELAKVAMAV